MLNRYMVNILPKRKRLIQARKEHRLSLNDLAKEIGVDSQ